MSISRKGSRLFLPFLFSAVFFLFAPSAFCISVLDSARLSCEAHKYGRDDFKIPEGYTVLLGHARPRGGFQGVAFEKTQTGEVVVAFSGTNFADPEDLLADLGIGISDTGALKRAIKILLHLEDQLVGGESEKEMMAVIKVAMNKMIFSPSENVRLQIDDARKFFKDVTSLMSQRKRFALLHRDFEDAGKEPPIVLTGHSLGGFLAQILASENDLSAHTFNAPGAAGMMNALGSPKIVNHVRRFDLAGIYGKHVGRVLNYPSSKISVSNYFMTFFIRNHVMSQFLNDLEQGMGSVSDGHE